MTNTTPAIISHRDLTDIDVLDECPSVQVTGRNLQVGMVLVDDLGTPAAYLSHYSMVGGPRNPGVKSWAIVDLDTMTNQRTTIGPDAVVRVMA